VLLFGFLLLLLLLLIFVVNLVGYSPRHQRDEVRTLVIERDLAIEALRQNRAALDQLFSACNALGELVGDMSKHFVLVKDDHWVDKASDYFVRALRVLRDGSPTFDESHVGRFYAVRTR
jgi:hypothetical protein